MMFFIQENLPQNAINDVCFDFAMESVNYPGTKYPKWNFKNTYIIEQDFLQTYPQSGYQPTTRSKLHVVDIV